MTEHEDEEIKRLTELWMQGDERALEVLLEQYLPGLRAFVRLRAGPLLRARESHSDLVQSVCREVLQHKERFQHPTARGFKQWLYTTAQRKIANRYEHWRAAKRDIGMEEPPAATETAAEGRLLAAYGSFCSPSREMMAQEEISRIERGFDKLSDEHREVILMAKVAGLSRAEIAEKLGKKEGAVRTLLSRALAKLAESLDTDEA